jgi:hypothetical protein
MKALKSATKEHKEHKEKMAGQLFHFEFFVIFRGKKIVQFS